MESQNAQILDHEFFCQFPLAEHIHRGLGYKIVNEEYHFTCFLLGVVTQENAPIYSNFGSRHLTIFEIFGSQVSSILSNRLHSDQIQNSKQELQKLSLIATNTPNSVIITDQFGRVEWVNKAFTTTTGYTLEETLGKKPKDFLQSDATQEKERKILSEALAKKDDVEVTIININKWGHPYYNQLQITPVFSESGEHTNFIAVQKDITKEILYQRESERIKNFFESILAHAPAEIAVISKEKTVLFYNRKEKNESTVLDFIQGKSLDDIIQINPEINAWIYRLKDVIDEASRTKELQQYEEVEWRRLNEDHYYLLSVQPFFSNIEADEVDYFIVSGLEISEQKKIEKAILRKNDELKKINSELDNFVYSVSHDLRSPLLSIKGILALIFSAYDVGEEVSKYLHLAENSINRLDGTIQEILEYSRNARLDVKNETFDLREMVQQIFEDIQFVTPIPVTFEIDIPGDSIVLADRARINTLIKNLASNSVKYRRTDLENPLVRFEMKRTAKSLEMKVIDNGRGIPEDQIEKVFGMFFRGSAQSQGTGLGLYIVKEILHKLGGQIMVKSKINEGTTMIFSLPLISE
jgi:PAS domain S-box-containing protein